MWQDICTYIYRRILEKKGKVSWKSGRYLLHKSAWRGQWRLSESDAHLLIQYYSSTGTMQVVAELLNFDTSCQASKAAQHELLKKIVSNINDCRLVPARCPCYCLTLPWSEANQLCSAGCTRLFRVRKLPFQSALCIASQFPLVCIRAFTIAWKKHCLLKKWMKCKHTFPGTHYTTNRHCTGNQGWSVLQQTLF